MATDFDDIFNAAKRKPNPQTPTPKPNQSDDADQPTRSPDPWAEMETVEREATIRLNVDIPIGLNDKLADKARALRKTKSELVRELLKWALE